MRVLLVEDEKALMLLAEEMLAALGYEPAGFTRGGEALAEFRFDPERFDAVVIDYLMPGMTGMELARHLRESRSDIPIVLVSGYTGPLLNAQTIARDTAINQLAGSNGMDWFWFSDSGRTGDRISGYGSGEVATFE